jgi:hypothetical protein
VVTTPTLQKRHVCLSGGVARKPQQACRSPNHPVATQHSSSVESGSNTIARQQHNVDNQGSHWCACDTQQFSSITRAKRPCQQSNPKQVKSARLPHTQTPSWLKKEPTAHKQTHATMMLACSMRKMLCCHIIQVRAGMSSHTPGQAAGLYLAPTAESPSPASATDWTYGHNSTGRAVPNRCNTNRKQAHPASPTLARGLWLSFATQAGQGQCTPPSIPHASRPAEPMHPFPWKTEP